MDDALKKFKSSESAFLFLRDKISEVEGLIQSGEVLKKALPKEIVIEGGLR